MTEKLLKEFFDGKATIDLLKEDLENSFKKTSHDTSTFYIESFDSTAECQIKRNHLVEICNAFINQKLSVEDLNVIAFAILVSDYFYWNEESKEGKIIENVLFDWDNPEMNFPITKANMIHWKYYLETGVYKLDKESKMKNTPYKK